VEIVDVTEAFGRLIDYFVGEYRAGRTPNPCVRCNQWIKFGLLMDLSGRAGGRYFATGHYARRVDVDGVPALSRGRDRAKDQSYALFGIGADRLGRVLLPVGELPGKDEARRLARQAGLPVHDKPDSQEICFVPQDDYVAFLAGRAPGALRPGEIVDQEGNVLGRHDGYARYTIGQRRGLDVAMGFPVYVTRIEPPAARVVVGPAGALDSRELLAEDANWLVDVPQEFDAGVQIRYHHCAAPARVRREGPGRFAVRFAQSVQAVTPGQAVVCYDGDRVLGGGWIAASPGSAEPHAGGAT
jgi:tRNA-specific 2-thiouridylase